MFGPARSMPNAPSPCTTLFAMSCALSVVGPSCAERARSHVTIPHPANARTIIPAALTVSGRLYIITWYPVLLYRHRLLMILTKSSQAGIGPKKPELLAPAG